VQLGHRLFTAGLALLALTLSGAVLLVLDVAVDRWFAIPAAVLTAIVLFGLWFLLPLLRPARAEPDDGEGHRPRSRPHGPDQ
jgi:glucose dehydrogenase